MSVHDTKTDPTLSLRRNFGQFATGVAVVTCRDAGGTAYGVTVNSLSSVSLEPPLLLWSLTRAAPSRPAFEGAKGFAVHVLARDQRSLADRFCRPAPDKFAGIETGENTFGAPVLPGCLARFDCGLHATLDGGDHVIVLGRIAGWDMAEGAPLLFYRGRYHQIGSAA